MSSKLLEKLKQQLARKGLDDPESVDGVATTLSQSLLGQVGGAGPITPEPFCQFLSYEAFPQYVG